MKKILPKSNLFQIRFHSIGGQGAYTTGQMIASMGFDIPNIRAAVFASYGSEKKGAPINVFVKFWENEKNVTNYSAVQNPDLVVVFHEKLLKTIDVLEGMSDDGIVIVNTKKNAEQLATEYNLNAKDIYCVDAIGIGIETGSKINTVMYGAVIKVLDFLDIENGVEQINKKLGYKYPDLVESNISACQLGYEQLEKSTNNKPYVETETSKANTLGYESQFAGGIILGANAQNVDRSISREGYLPEFKQEVCINCTKCDLNCPDDCFVWEEKEGRRGRMEMVLQGIDYQFCKGCLRCVEACPTDALKTIIEEENFADNNTQKKIFDFVKGTGI